MVPALRALRAALPEAHISLVGLSQAAFLVERFPHYLDELIEFPGWPGMPELELQPTDLPPFLSEMQRQQFDLAVQMHGSGTTFNPVTVLFNASYNAGQYLPGQYCPDPSRFVTYEQDVPEVLRCLKIVEQLGFNRRGIQLEFPLSDQDFAEVQAVLSNIPADFDQFICLHPGASTPVRRWPPEYFAEVGDKLAAQGFTVVLTGSDEETGLVEEVARRMTGPVVKLAGKLSLGGVAALFKKARLLICNDTGVSHLADAVQVRSVVIFISSGAQVWAPLDRQLHRVVVSPLVEGSLPPHESFSQVPPRLAVARVLSEANELLTQDQRQSRVSMVTL